MSGQSPFFLTGANAKIKMDGKTVAFATDIAYRVSVEHATPQLLGMYEVANVEPLVYKVSGTMNVIRYAKNMRGFLESRDHGFPSDVANSGNGIGAFRSGSVLNNTITGNSGKVYQSLNPADMQNATKFDVEIYQKSLEKDQKQGVARLRDCRIVAVDFVLTKRGMATQKITFQAIYLDEDSLRAEMSGLGQQFM